MEKINFSVDSNYALNIGGQHIDLHNNFDFRNLEYLSEENALSVSWVKTKGDWVQSNEAENLQIVFEDVLFLKIQGNVSNTLADRKNLSFIGYLHPEDEDLMDGCLDESEANSTYHMIFAFENSLIVKIFSSKVICLLG
ncbi:MAG: hypothetical protein ABJL73_01580 [Lentilitoribacter sp.]